MQYWLMKSEPDCYSIMDLKREKVGSWTDVRNYQARNFLRAMKKGDGVLFYHSSCKEVGIVGLATVVKEAYPDPTQFKLSEDGYDPKSTTDNPRWSAVDVKFVKEFKTTLTLSELKADTEFAGMEVTKQGSRLSVHPVTEAHYNRVIAIAAKHT
jgi:predicted RNA-binding protein with PUA-like domain